MRLAYRKILACSLLATYGVVALLGQGLHWLSAEDAHHHGLSVAHCHSHGPGHSHSHVHTHQHVHKVPDCCHAEHDAALALECGDGASLCSECGICAFLSQIKCERPQIAASEIWQHVIRATSAALQRTYSPITLGLPSPRGPPISPA